MRKLGGMTLAAAAAMAATPALAHTGAGSVSEFSSGFLHPLGGMDHLIAMVAAGLFAASLGGRALWLVPAAFVGCMAIGGGLGVAGVELPYVELAIVASVIVLGAVVAIGGRWPVALAMGLVGFFAIFHGHAHGSEGPGVAGFAPYAIGFVLATAMLHVAGIALGLGLGRLGGTAESTLRRVAGAAGMVAGLALFLG